MEAITIIIISCVIISANAFQYMLNSRCSRIQCTENCYIERDVINEDKINNNFKTDIKNTTEEQL